MNHTHMSWSWTIIRRNLFIHEFHVHDYFFFTEQCVGGAIENICIYKERKRETKSDSRMNHTHTIKKKLSSIIIFVKNKNLF